MIKYRIFVFILFLIYNISAANAQDIRFTGYARNYNSVLIRQEQQYAILQNSFDLNIEHSKDSMSLNVNPYIYSNSDRTLDIGLRELYLDIYFDAADIRIGKQQIIWGRADGVFITDIVSPKNMKDFLLPDFDEIRLGVTAIKADYYLGNDTFELVWVPVFTATQMPEIGSIWYKGPQMPVTPTMDYSQKDIEAKFQNSEVFVKYSHLGSALDYELMAGYTWDDEPALHLTRTINPQTGSISSIIVMPRHHRLEVIGGSAGTSLGGMVVRGEAAFYKGKYFSTNEVTDQDGVEQKDYVHYLIGVDSAIWDVKFSVQFIQRMVLNYTESLAVNAQENTATLLFRKDFLRETLHLELFSYFELDDVDMLIRPKISYDMADGFVIMLGADIFKGNSGRFGQYADNDMVYTKATYIF